MFTSCSSDGEAKWPANVLRFGIRSILGKVGDLDMDLLVNVTTHGVVFSSLSIRNIQNRKDKKRLDVISVPMPSFQYPG